MVWRRECALLVWRVLSGDRRCLRSLIEWRLCSRIAAFASASRLGLLIFRRRERGLRRGRGKNRFGHLNSLRCLVLHVFFGICPVAALLPVSSTRLERRRADSNLGRISGKEKFSFRFQLESFKARESPIKAEWIEIFTLDSLLKHRHGTGFVFLLLSLLAVELICCIHRV